MPPAIPAPAAPIAAPALPTAAAARAGRAIGAEFFSVFGGLWIVLGLAAWALSPWAVRPVLTRRN